MNWAEDIKWNEQGLIPAIAQDEKSGEILMVAWMDVEALRETIETSKAVYWSRSRKKLWRKGEESGHQQIVSEVRIDCDSDVVLMKVEQLGVVSIKYLKRVSDQLAATLEERKGASGDSSYVASLYEKGVDSILKKIGEEATETVMAAKDGDAKEIIYETADLWFHCMVLLSQQGLSHQDVLAELARRFNLSGLEEKASRTK